MQITPQNHWITIKKKSWIKTAKWENNSFILIFELPAIVSGPPSTFSATCLLTRGQQEFHPRSVLWYHRSHFSTVIFTDFLMWKVPLCQHPHQNAAPSQFPLLLGTLLLHNLCVFNTQSAWSSLCLNYSHFSGTFQTGVANLLLAFILPGCSSKLFQFPHKTEAEKFYSFTLLFWAKCLSSAGFNRCIFSWSSKEKEAAYMQHSHQPSWSPYPYT